MKLFNHILVTITLCHTAARFLWSLFSFTAHFTFGFVFMGALGLFNSDFLIALKYMAPSSMKITHHDSISMELKTHENCANNLLLNVDLNYTLCRSIAELKCDKATVTNMR